MMRKGIHKPDNVWQLVLEFPAGEIRTVGASQRSISMMSGGIEGLPMVFKSMLRYL